MSDDNEQYDPKLIQSSWDDASKSLDREDWWEIPVVIALAIFAGWFLLGGTPGVILVGIIVCGVFALALATRLWVLIAVLLIWVLVLIPGAIHILGQRP